MFLNSFKDLKGLEKIEYLITKISDYLKADKEKIKIYNSSLTEVDGTTLLMAKVDSKKVLLAAGEGKIYDELHGLEGDGFKICATSHENRLVLNTYLDYTVPKAFGKKTATFGMGDRLGIASPAHIKTIIGRNVKPILAQQSKRELRLTGRSYDDVLDDACFAVMQEGYRGGFGADGDHLKEEEDIKTALDAGFSMITLDCSEKIDTSVENCSFSEIEEKYKQLPKEVRKYYEDSYLDREFVVGSNHIVFNNKALIKNVLIYAEAINFIEEVYTGYILCQDRNIDFEISLDETILPTSIHGHYLVAAEMGRRKIKANSVAPRFVGEFQKGIDYIGDIDEFEKDFKKHAEIADHFGYKLSIHSGSDKFSVFEIIGKHTKGRLHIKTSGTNWLEAVRVIARKNPSLYRRMHFHALKCFERAKEYYHVTTDIKAIKDLSIVTDNELEDYMNDNNGRQLLHITYGMLLGSEEDGGKVFKDEIYNTLNEYEDEYEKALVKHIGRHMDMLGL